MILDAPPEPPPDEQPDAVAGAASAPTGPDGPGDPGTRRTLALVQQCAWSVVWLGVLTVGLVYWASWTAGPWAAVLAPLLSLVALAGFVLVWTDRRPVASALQWLGLVVSLVVVTVAQGTGIHGRHYYLTDSAAFNPTEVSQSTVRSRSARNS